MSQVQQKKSSKANEVIEKPNFAVANSYLDEFGGAGLENITSENMSMPFIKMISDASPERKKMSEKYIEGADTGMIANTVTKKLYDGTKGILCVPCFYKFEYVEWMQRGQGQSAPVTSYPANSDILSKCTRNPVDNREMLPNGNYIEPTNYHFVLLLNEDGTPDTTGLITMSRTQSKKSRKWNSMMKAMPKLKNAKGDFVSSPSFFHSYRLTTTQETNSKGSWTSWIINHAGKVESELVLQTASEFYKTCAKGVVVKHEEENETNLTEQSNTNQPF